MIFASGPVNAFHFPSECQSINYDNVRSFQSPDFLFVAVLTSNTVHVWSLKPVCLLGFVERDSDSITALGANTTLAWHGESRLFVVCTKKGALLIYCLNPSSSVFFPPPSSEEGTDAIQNRLTPAFGLHQVKSLNFEIAACGSLETGIVSIQDVVFVKSILLLISNMHKGQLLRATVTPSNDIQLEKPIILFPPTKITKLEYYELIDMVIWLDESGKLYGKTNASNSLEGWNGKEITVTNLSDEITSQQSYSDFALNLKYKILTTWNERERLLQSFQVTSTLTYLWSFPKHSLQVHSIKWSVSFSYLLVTYKCGTVEIFSCFGDLLFTTNNSLFSATNDVFFTVRDCDLFFFPNSNLQKFFSISLLKCSALFDTNNYSKQNAILLDETYQSTYSVKQEEMESRAFMLQEECVNFPHSYYIRNLPIRIVSTSPNGKFLFIAGNRGFALYFKIQRKWNLFERRDDEDEFLVICPPCWHNDFLFVVIHNSEGLLRLRLYYSQFPLTSSTGESSCLAECPLDKRIVCLSFCNEHIFAIDVNNHLYIYKFHQLLKDFSSITNQFSICLKAQISLEREGNIHDSILINNFQVTKEKREKETFYYLWLVENGVVKVIGVKQCSNGIISITSPAYSIDSHCYWFIVENDYLVVFKGKSVAIHFLNNICQVNDTVSVTEVEGENICQEGNSLQSESDRESITEHQTNGTTKKMHDSSSSSSSIKEPDILIESLDFITAIDWQMGCIISVNNSLHRLLDPFQDFDENDSAEEKPAENDNSHSNSALQNNQLNGTNSFSLKVKYESFAGKIAKYHLSKKQHVPHSLTLHSNSLELLLYHSFESYLNSPMSFKSQQDLSQTFSFLQSQNLTHLAILVARKTDCKYWKMFFNALKIDPLKIFLSSIEDKNYSISLASLLVLREFYSDDELLDNCLVLEKELLNWFLLNSNASSDCVNFLGELLRFTQFNDKIVQELVSVLKERLLYCGYLYKWNMLRRILPSTQQSLLTSDNRLKEIPTDLILIGLYIDYELFVEEEDQEMEGEGDYEVIKMIKDLQFTKSDWYDRSKLNQIIDELMELKEEFVQFINITDAIDEFLFIKRT